MPDTESSFWDKRYTRDDYLFGTEANTFLRSQAHLFAPGQKVLSVADGEGRNGVFLAKLGACVTALDFSEVALEKGRRLADEAGVTIKSVHQNLFKWQAEEAAFDAVVAIFIQFAPPEKRGALFEQIKHTIKPGGLLVMQGYRPEQINNGTGGPSTPENLYTADLLREAFSDFEILHLEEHDDVIEEGTGHAGISALIDLIARKPA
jgi:cyclopropane fatty-acyl-phospholipid synthase-like methyltransferase